MTRIEGGTHKYSLNMQNSITICKMHHKINALPSIKLLKDLTKCDRTLAWPETTILIYGGLKEILYTNHILTCKMDLIKQTKTLSPIKSDM